MSSGRPSASTKPESLPKPNGKDERSSAGAEDSLDVFMSDVKDELKHGEVRTASVNLATESNLHLGLLGCLD